MEKPSSARLSLKWGIISSLISIIINTIAYNTDLWKQSTLILLFGVLLSSILIFLCQREFKSLNQGYMTFSEGVGLGLLFTMVSSLIAIAFDFIYKNFIDLSINEKVMNFTEEQLENRGVNPEQIEEFVKRTSEYQNSGLAFLIGMFILMLLGLIISLIISAILQKKKPVFD